MMKKWKCIEVKGRIWIPFQWMDLTPGGNNLGHAEFQVCLKFKNKKVSEYWVYPRQQRDTHNYWHYKGNCDDFFAIASYDSLEYAQTWMVTYCPEHKTPSLHIYVPRDSKFLMLDYHGISFHIKKWGE